jgi:DNA-binding MarR family transcriptional regulator
MRKVLYNDLVTYPVQMEVREYMDTIREFGAMAFASRLKRLGDRLKSDATKLYRANGVEFNDSWFLVALALSNREGISVVDIANAFRVSHPAISQIVTAMQRKGLVSARADERDRRRRVLHLTKKGRSAIRVLRPIWEAIGASTEELIASTGTDFLAAISDIEEQLERKSLFTRVTGRMNGENG